MDFKLIKLNDEESDLGSSHILGCPDVPSIWNDNAVFYNDEIFIGQINLAEFDIIDLPNKGILSFYLAIASSPYRGIVRYSDNKELERIDFNNEIDFKYDLNEEYLIIPGEGELQILPKNHKFKKYHLKKDERILMVLNLPFMSDAEYDIVYLIKDEDLKSLSFDKAYLAINLDN